MRHDLTIEGAAFRLRPVTLDDAAFIAALRSNECLATFIHYTPPDVVAQRAWIDAYLSRPGDYYFIVERHGTPEGTIGIYDIDAATGRAEWGRWVLLPGSLAAPESAWLIYTVGLDRLGLTCLYSRTIAENERVISFHYRCGMTPTATRSRVVNGLRRNLVEFEMVLAQWTVSGPRLAHSASQVARILSRGVAAHE